MSPASRPRSVSRLGSQSEGPTSWSAARRSWGRIETSSNCWCASSGARSFASHGEAWGAALCLRLGLASAVVEEIGDPPVLLLDDPFSALDPVRQRQVAARLVDRGQVFVSVADEAHVPELSAGVWDVTAGSIAGR